MGFRGVRDWWCSGGTTSEHALSQSVLDRPAVTLPRSYVLRPAWLLLPLALALLWVWSPPTPRLRDDLQDVVTLAVSVLVESLPFVIAGIVISVVVQLWVPAHALVAWLPRRAWARRAVLSLLGVLFPVCECGNVPLARGLMARGLSVSESMTFLLAAPILNPITMVVTYQAFGFGDGILVARVLGAFVIANGVGWLVSRHPEPERLMTNQFRESCARHDHPHGPRLLTALPMVLREAGSLLPALMLGAVVAGVIQVAVSRNILLTLGQNPVWSVLALMCLAFVIAICSTVDAFFVLSFGSTFTPGAITAFLVMGAMVDVKMITLLRTTFTTTTLALMTGLVVLSTLVLGLGMNLV